MRQHKRWGAFTPSVVATVATYADVVTDVGVTAAANPTAVAACDVIVDAAAGADGAGIVGAWDHLGGRAGLLMG